VVNRSSERIDNLKVVSIQSEPNLINFACFQYSISEAMRNLFLLPQVSCFKKAALALIVTVWCLVNVRAQTSDISVLESRVIDATKGLNEAALVGFTDDANVTSYQSKAFLRLSQQIGVDGFTDAKIAQYYALYSIYYATNAVPNHITDNDIRFENIVMPQWLQASGWTSNNSDPCGVISIDLMNDTESSIATTLSTVASDGWYGVTCDTEGRVIALELFSNILTGTWPEEVLLLASDGPFSTGAGSLEKLDLYDNEFLSNGGDSSWMSELGSNMSKLRQRIPISNYLVETRNIPYMFSQYSLHFPPCQLLYLLRVLDSVAISHYCQKT